MSYTDGDEAVEKRNYENNTVALEYITAALRACEPDDSATMQREADATRTALRDARVEEKK